MIAPPFLIGAALAFWGWQSGHLVVGVALGAVLEAPRYLKLRLDLGAVEHSRIADLSTVGFVALAILLAAPPSGRRFLGSSLPEEQLPRREGRR